MQSHYSEFFNRVYRLAQEEQADQAFEPEDYLWDRFNYESTYRGLTPLMIASLTGEIDIANELMTDPSFSLYDISCIGDTALMCAAAEGHTDIVKLLLDSDANLEEGATEQGTTAGFIDMRNDPFLEDKGGNTALMLAHMGGHQETAELLLSAGVDGTIKNNSGKDAMIAAIKYGRQLAATKLQSSERGRQVRARAKLYEKWRGIMAYDIGQAEEVDICDWLQKDVHNFVIRLPRSTNYEAWNVDDIITMNKVKEVGTDAYNFFFECKGRDENNWQDPPEDGRESNVITDTLYIKLASCNLVTMLPDWLNPDSGIGGVPEPRVFHLVHKKTAKALVSIPLLRHYKEMMEYAFQDYVRRIAEVTTMATRLSEEEIAERASRVDLEDTPLQSADHCNHLEPVKIYKLIGDNEPVIARADGQGGGSSMKSYRKKKSKEKSKEKKRKKCKKRTKRKSSR